MHVFFTLHFSKPKKKGNTRLGDEERRLMHLVPAPAVIIKREKGKLKDRNEEDVSWLPGA